MSLQPRFYQQSRIPSTASLWWRKFTNNKLATGALILLCGIILIALFAPVIAPFDPAEQFEDLLTPPTGIWKEKIFIC